MVNFRRPSARRSLIVIALALVGALDSLGSPTPLRAAEDIDSARRLLLEGKYEEAAEAFQTLLEKSPPAAALGLARCRASTGQTDEAGKVLTAALARLPEESADRAPLHAELAELAFARGDYAEAQAQVAAGRAADDQNLAARWIAAELLRVSGKLDEAGVAYKWFVEYYNAHEVTDPYQVRTIGRAAAHFARWNRLSDQFSFLVNELYPDALAHDKRFWPAHYESGLLFLEKFNQADASRELKAALAINPHAAEAYAALAHLALTHNDLDAARQAVERALEINPQLLTARHAKADLLMANFQVAEAAKYLEEARALNPVSEATLGRLAAAYLVLDGAAPQELDKGPAESRAAKLMAEVDARNPHAGEFYYALATRLEERRQFVAAERFFRAAIERMPQLVGPHAGLGMMDMRLGEEAEAKKLLDEAFEIDPFNVRVSNTLKVLEVLDGYVAIETEHFLLKFDPDQDKLLAHYAARRLEEVYPELVKLLGYEPRGKSLFEIFNRAKNTDGHGWFSARMVGLPYVGTVGACAGKMVALASPNSMPKKFNWARVVKHEFVHVINLQQTNFNIPHWFTEAIAVWNEGYPRPQEWNQLLARRSAAGELFNLDTINFGFIRPESSDDWQMAYCQAELYAEYLLGRFGDAALAKMLAAYADHLDTPAALKRALGIEQADFEAGYRDYVQKIVAQLSAASEPAKMKLADLERAQRADAKNPDLMARLAQAYLERRDYPEARRLAREALARNPKQQLATYVAARLQLLVGDNGEAVKTLEEGFDEAAPQEDLVNLLAGLKVKANRFDDAARLYQIMSARQPDEIRWPKALARVYLLSKQNQPLVAVLKRLAELDADDVTVRKKLSDLAFQAGDFGEAALWARRALEIDVLDIDIHRLLADALARGGDPANAIEEYVVAIDLDDKDLALRLALADAYFAAADKAKARETLEELLRLAPDHAEAKARLEKLKPSNTMQR